MCIYNNLLNPRIDFLVPFISGKNTELKDTTKETEVTEGILDLVGSAVEMACCGRPSMHWMLYQRYDLVARAKPNKKLKIDLGLWESV